MIKKQKPFFTVIFNDLFMLVLFYCFTLLNLVYFLWNKHSFIVKGYTHREVLSGGADLRLLDGGVPK